MEYIKSIINSIEKVFDVSEENISSLTVMLADIETSHLYNKFSAEEQSKNIALPGFQSTGWKPSQAY